MGVSHIVVYRYMAEPVPDGSLGETNITINTDDDQDQKTTADIVDAMAKSLEKSIFNCSSCGQFFKTAVFAVFGIGTVCETCLLGHKLWQGQRLEFYSIMLKNLSVVPCPYADEGCKIYVLPTEAAADFHTKDCKYRPAKCAVPDCPWQNKLVDLTKHFEETHQDDIINKETVVKLDLKLDSFVTVKLFVGKHSKYFLIIKREQGANEIMYLILNESGTDHAPHCADIKFFCRDGSGTFTVQIDTQKFSAIDHDWKKVNLLILNAIFGAKNTLLLITVDVDVLSKAEKLLRCSGCHETMRPPIYQCEEEHGMCDSCSSNLAKCSICQSAICQNARLLSLEALTSNVLYPCIYQKSGCKARVYIDEEKHHQAQCGFSRYVSLPSDLASDTTLDFEW